LFGFPFNGSTTAMRVFFFFVLVIECKFDVNESSVVVEKEKYVTLPRGENFQKVQIWNQRGHQTMHLLSSTKIPNLRL